MSIFSSNLLDETTVYWDPPIRDGLGGYSWNYPSEILGKWQYSVGGNRGPTLRFLSDGSEVVSRTSVWVDSLVKLGGYLWKGSLEELQTIFTPNPSFIYDKKTSSDIYELAAQITSIQKITSNAGKDNIVLKAYLDGN